METNYQGNSKLSGTYKIINKINNKIYIGSTKEFKARAKQHLKLLEQNKHGNQHLQNAFNVHGTDAFVFEVIQVIEGTKQDRLDAEQLLLDIYWDNCQNCYNVDKKSQSREGNKSKNPEETKIKKSESAKKMWSNPEYREKLLPIIAISRAKPRSQEARKNISEAHQGIWNKTQHPMSGKKHSPETIEKMRQIKLGKKHTEEQKKKIGEASKKYWALKRTI